METTVLMILLTCYFALVGRLMVSIVFKRMIMIFSLGYKHIPNLTK